MFGLANYQGPWLFRAQNGAVTSVAIGRGTIISNAYALYLAAKLGIGPALLPDWLIADDLTQGNLIDLFPDHRAAATDFDTAIWLLYPSRTHLPSKVRATIDFLRRRMVRRGA
jgi:DNA-binding transcriptional LysR family regulator